MTIIDKIKKSVEGATALDFLYHAAGEMNELIARAERLPVAFAFLIDSGTIEDVNGRYHERVTLAVMFTDKTQFDFNALENEEIIDRMKVKAYKWLQSLRMSNTLRIVSINSTKRLYDNTTDILTGFAVNITIDDIAGVGECELPQVVIDVDKNGSYDVVGVDKVIVNIVPRLEELDVAKNGEYIPPTDIAGFSKVSVDVQPTLKELIITKNGTYTPQDGVDGFSKVTAEFDTSSLPKVKVASLRVTNDCINEDGRWEGEKLIDTTNCTSFFDTFENNTKVTHLDLTNLDVSNVTTLRECFQGCTSLVELNVSNWNTSNVTSLWYTFYGIRMSTLDIANWNTSNVKEFLSCFRSCGRLIQLDLTNWSAKSATTIMEMFMECYALTSLVGGKSIDDIIVNNIRVLDGLKISVPFNTFYYATNLDRASLRALINGLADLTGQTTQTLTLGATLMAKLTEEDIAIAVNKNWTMS